MSKPLSVSNPPNPSSVHAGKKVESSFMSNLAQTLNSAHAFASPHIYSQGFSKIGGFVFTAYGPCNFTQQVRVVAPFRSGEHDRIIYRIYASHVSNGASTSHINITLRELKTNSLIAAVEQATIPATANGDRKLITGTIALSSVPLHLHQAFSIDIGITADGGESRIEDITLAWEVLKDTEMDTTNYRTTDGVDFIQPVGTGALSTNRPLSAAVGRALINQSNVLQRTLRPYVSVSAISGTLSNNLNGSEAFLPPRVQPHTILVPSSSEPITVYFNVRSVNDTNAAHDWKMIRVRTESCFEVSAMEPDFFSSSGEEYTKSVAANTTSEFIGHLTIRPPFDTLPSVPDLHFITLALGTRAMVPRRVFRYNDGDTPDNGLRLTGYSIWGP